MCNMKKTVSLMLAAFFLLTLAACGGDSGEGDGQSGSTQESQSGAIQSRGLFWLERKDGEELDDLTAQETYLIHVYDILPDESQNVEMGVFESNYSMTMNGVNTYEPLYAPVSYSVDGYSIPSSAQYFMLSSGYAAPPELGTVLAGGGPIRAMSIYQINRNDIGEDTTAVFSVTGCGLFDCELQFDREDMTAIQRFDDIFQIEEDPTSYQIAAAYFQRVKSICNNSASGIFFNKLLDNGLASYQNALNIVGFASTYGVYSTTKLEGFVEGAFPDGAEDTEYTAFTELPPFDPAAVKTIYPGLPVDAFESALQSWLTNGQAALDAASAGGSTGEVGKLADAAVADLRTYGQEILDFYTAKLSGL